MGLGPPGCGQPPGHPIVCGKLLAENAAHFADGLHAADQILLHRHMGIPPKIRFVLGMGLRMVSSPLVL